MSALCKIWQQSLQELQEETNHSFLFCLKSERQVTLLLLRRALTVALCICTVPFTPQFQERNKKVLLNVPSPWALNLVIPMYVWGKFWVLFGKIKLLHFLWTQLKQDQPLCWEASKGLHPLPPMGNGKLITSKIQFSWTKIKLRKIQPLVNY